jgi:hypothetical protein
MRRAQLAHDIPMIGKSMRSLEAFDRLPGADIAFAMIGSG